MKKLSRKLVALTLAVIMVFATCMTALADDSTDTYTATFYKNDSTTETSMANKAVAGNAVVTESNGKYTLTIPVQPIEYNLLLVKYYGYISSMTLTDPESNAEYVANVSETPYTDSTGTITINNLSGISSRYDVQFEVEVYDEDGNYVGTPHEIVSLAPQYIYADLYLNKLL